MTLDVQLQTMLTMIVGGFYLGVSLETFRRFSPHWEDKVVWKYIFECIFWVSQTFILFYVLYLVNAGELRLYILAACLLGFAIYQGLASNLYKRLLEKIIVGCKSIARFLIKVFSTVIFRPIKWLVVMILLIALFLVRTTLTIVLFFIKPVFQLLRYVGKLIYHGLPPFFKRKLYKFKGFYSIIENTLRKWLSFVTFNKRR